MTGENLKKQLLKKGFSTEELAGMLDICEKELESIFSSDNIPEDKLSDISKRVGENIYNFEADSKPSIVDGDHNSIGSYNQNNKVILKLLSMLEKKDAQLEAKDVQLAAKDKLIEQLVNRLQK